MNKNFKKLLFAMPLTAGTLTFVSCGDDDDGKNCVCTLTYQDGVATIGGNTTEVNDFKGNCADITIADLNLGNLDNYVARIDCVEK